MVLMAKVPAAPAQEEPFQYLPFGQLIAGSGTGVTDCTVYDAGLEFPIDFAPSFANSQVYRPGGMGVPSNPNECDFSNYSYPWQDNFCEDRSGTGNPVNPACPDGSTPHHQGQDIRPSTCVADSHLVVGAVSGTVTFVEHGGSGQNSVVSVQSSTGRIYSYLHMTDIQVSEGTVVNQGDPLGRVGSIDDTTTHLHFEFTDDPPFGLPPYTSLVDAYRRKVGPMLPGSFLESGNLLRVRNAPAGAIIGTVASGEQGVFSGGSAVAQLDGLCYWWREVDWGSGLSGWSVDNYLYTIGGQCVPGLTGGCGGEGPDLVVINPTVDDSTLELGQAFSTTVVTRNDGDETSDPTTVRFMLSSDSMVTTSDTEMSSDAVGSLQPTAVEGDSDQNDAPSVAGMYWVGGCVDSVPDETNATNNCSVGVPITVGDSGGTQPVDLINNGGFEDDGDHWSISGDFYADDRFGNSHSGTGYAYLSEFDGSGGNNLLGVIYQELTIPGNAESAVLRYWISISTSEPGGAPAKDFLNATLQDEDGNFLAGLEILSNQDSSGGVYFQRIFNLENFIGETIRIHFLGTTDSSMPTVFRIDSASLVAEVPSGGPPSVTTDGHGNVSDSSARLHLTINPNGLETEIWFDLEANDSSPNDQTVHINVGSGTVPFGHFVDVSGLNCETEYFYEANAANSAGSDNGSTQSFLTDDCSGGPPTADTDPADTITQTSAILTADILPNGLPTDAWFEWGLTASLGNSTPTQSVGSGSSWTDFEQVLTELACETTYFFEAHAQNSAGSDEGITHSFTTSDCNGPPLPTDDLILYTSRQGCAGDRPAVLLGWFMAEGVDPEVTVRRVDGQYSAVVDTSNEGRNHLVSTGLVHGGAIPFQVEGSIGGSPVASNIAIAYITEDTCQLLVGDDDAPHRPLIWADPPYCEGGVPKVRLQWTEATGATTYCVERTSLWIGGNAQHQGLVSTSFVDDDVLAGGGANYLVTAQTSAGETEAFRFGVQVPGTICEDPGHPGAFEVQASEPVCYQGDRGEFTATWTQAANGLPEYRWFGFEDHLLRLGGDSVDDFMSRMRLDPGFVATMIVQAESSVGAGQFREAYPVARRFAADICGTGTPPRISVHEASFVAGRSARISGGTVPEGSPTTAYLEWGLDATYGNTTPPRDMGNGSSWLHVGEDLHGLVCSTTYHFRTTATNAHGTVTSEDQAFTTDACSSLIFSDAFESGDTSAWTLAVP